MANGEWGMFVSARLCDVRLDGPQGAVDLGHIVAGVVVLVDGVPEVQPEMDRFGAPAYIEVADGKLGGRRDEAALAVPVFQSGHRRQVREGIGGGGGNAVTGV